MRSSSILLGLFLLSFGACSSSNGQRSSEPVDGIFYLVRHAEKVEDGSEDPPLTDIGKERSIMLAAYLSNKNIEAVYATTYLRSYATAYPTAMRTGHSVISYSSRKPADEFVDELLQKHSQDTVLVVGHSNTIPEMLNVFADEQQYQQLAADDYDDIFIVRLRGKEAEIQEFSYREAMSGKQ